MLKNRVLRDIDIDFQENRREEVIDYCKEKYGDKSVASIITFGTMAARKIVEDMCRVYDISDKFEKPNKFAEYIKSFIPMEPKMTLKKAMDENPEFRAVYETNENVKFIVDESKKLEGLKRNVSTHACGKVICNGDINQYCPTVSIYDKDTDSWQRTAAWNMTEIEEIGLLKMDFLGLKTMTLLQQSVDTINEIYGKNMTISDIPLNDVETYQYIAKGNTVGVFQLESSGMTSTMMQMYSDVTSRVKAINSMKITEEEKEDKKQTLGNEFFERLIAGISLYRPGPMDSIPAYITGMLTGEIHYDTPELESILSNTYGQLVYQEQVIQTVQKLAGFTPGQADSIRKAMGKKKQDIVDEYGPYFIYGSGKTLDSHTKLPLNIKGCVANGIEEKTAKIIWDKMYDFAKYAFNKSHAAAYAVNSIRTAWLACHYPEIFRKSLLNVFIINQDKVKLYLSEIVQKDIPLLPPSVNYSEDLFSIENKKSIRFGLGGIKRVKKLALAIQDERKERGFFTSYRDFVERIITYQNGNKAAIESLVLAGALDDFDGTRKAKVAMIEPLIERLKSGIEYQVDGQSTIFQLDNSLSVFKDMEMPKLEEYDENTMYFKEEEVTGLFITGHPLDKYLKTLSILGAVNLSKLLSQEDEVSGETIPSVYLNEEVFISGILSEVTARNSTSGKMFTFKIKDRTSEIRCVAFNKVVTTYGEELFKDNQLVTIHGKLTNNEFGDQIIVQTISSIENLPTDIKEIEIKCSDNWDEAQKQGKLLEKALKDETGETLVYCHYANKDGKVIRWNPSQFPKIQVSYSAFSEIQRIVGETNVTLK